jgi:hypothetical protein
VSQGKLKLLSLKAAKIKAFVSKPDKLKLLSLKAAKIKAFVSKQTN